MAQHTMKTGIVLDDADPDDRKILAKQREAARQAGRDGGDREGTAGGRADLESAYDEGAAEGAEPTDSAPAAAPAAKAAAPAGKTSGNGRKSSGGRTGVLKPGLRIPRTASAKDAGGFAFGLLLYAITVSYIRYGATGPKGWLSAKFLNRPLQGDDLAPIAPGATQPGTGRGPNGETSAEGNLDPTKPIV